jgi:putative phosphoribosyl transferase
MRNREGGLFADRARAGRALAVVVAQDLGRHPGGGRPIVLALPRGGVPVAYEVARALDADLDVLVARKIGLPWQQEFGIGAVAEHGTPLFDEWVLRQVGLTETELAPAVERERAEVRRRLRTYRGNRPPPDLTGRTVVVVDDGLATGVTARAALRGLRGERPARLIFAAPVCAADSAELVRADADAVLCVRRPEDFGAVGAWYEDFRQLTDDEVSALLQRAWHSARTG